MPVVFTARCKGIPASQRQNAGDVGRVLTDTARFAPGEITSLLRCHRYTSVYRRLQSQLFIQLFIFTRLLHGEDSPRYSFRICGHIRIFLYTLIQKLTAFCQ